MDMTMRDDIWYRGSYQPTGAGERRVILSDFNAWLVDRAGHDLRGQLTWHAEHLESPAAKAALNGFAQMRQQLATPGLDTGFFLPEQLCQFAATLAARRCESHGDPASVCGELARAMIQTLIAMPLTQAMTNLAQAELVPDNAATVQAQLLLHAAYQTNTPRIAARAIELRQRGTFNWDDAQDLSEHSDLTRQLHLSSPALVSALRRDLDKQSLNEDGTLNYDWCHFAANTAIAEPAAWLDQADNIPTEHPRKSGTICVVENWITGERQALIQDGEDLMPMEADSSRAKTAVATYAAALSQQQMTLPHLNPLQREGIAQRAAQLSRFELTTPAEAITNAVLLAYKEASGFFRVHEELWRPLGQPEATENPSGTLRMRELHQQVEHLLTRHGIAHMLALYRKLADAHQRDDVQYRQTPDSVSFQVELNDTDARLNHKTTPLARLAVVGTLSGPNLESFEPMSDADKPAMLAAANLAHHEFVADDGPAFAHELPHSYTVKLVTERFTDNDDRECDDETEVLDADELIRLVRDKGITRNPHQVEQYGDGSWSVSYRSESPEENRAYFEQGIETYYTLRLEQVNGQPVNPDNAQVFAEEVGLNFSNPYEAPVSRSATPRFG